MSEPIAQDAQPSLNRAQVVRIASRICILYLLFWVIDDLTLLPRQILTVAHYMRTTGSVLGTNTSLPISSYYLRLYALDLLANLLRIPLWLMAAGWLYRCGPRIQEFFAPGPEMSNQ